MSKSTLVKTKVSSHVFILFSYDWLTVSTVNGGTVLTTVNNTVCLKKLWMYSWVRSQSSHRRKIHKYISLSRIFTQKHKSNLGTYIVYILRVQPFTRKNNRADWTFRGTKTDRTSRIHKFTKNIFAKNREKT